MSDHDPITTSRISEDSFVSSEGPVQHIRGENGSPLRLAVDVRITEQTGSDRKADSLPGLDSNAYSDIACQVPPAHKAPKPKKPRAEAEAEPVPTLVGNVLGNIPDGKYGMNIETFVEGHQDGIDRVRNALTYDTTLFQRALVDLGVHENFAGRVVYDGGFNDLEGVEAMSQIGNTTFADITPRAETIKAIDALSKSVEKKEGITPLSARTKEGLARFEEGMLTTLNRIHHGHERDIQEAFEGRLNDGDVIDAPETLVYGIVDLVNAGTVLKPAPGPQKPKF